MCKLRLLPRFSSLSAGALAFLLTGAVAAAQVPTTLPVPVTAADLFQPSRVWTVHFRFTAQQWAAMEPTGAGDWRKIFNFGQPVAAPPDIADWLSSAMLKRADRNHDGRLSREELLALADTWFTWWDIDRAGRINLARIQAGLDQVLDPEGLSQPGVFSDFLGGTPGTRNGLAPAVGLEFKQVHADLDFQDAPFHDVGVRYKGNGTFIESRSTFKRSLKVELPQFVKGQKLAGVTKLNFHNNVADPSFMNESLSYRLYRDAGVPAPRTAYAMVYVTVPGKHDHRYFGLYSLVENVDTGLAEDRFATAKGVLFKPVTPSLFADLGPDWSDYQQTYDAKTRVSPGQARRVMEFSALVSHASDADFAARLGQYLDLDEFARYMAVTAYLSTMDSILLTGQNFFVYLHPKTNRFQFIPWDMDHSFGQIFGEQAQLANLNIRRPWAGSNRFLERVFQVEAFKKLYLSYLGQFSQTIFKPQRFHQQVDELAAAIRPAIERESPQKLAQFDKTVAAEPPKPGFWIFAPKGVKSIKAFVDARTPSVLAQVAGQSTGQPAQAMGPVFGRHPAAPPKSLSPAFFAALQPSQDGQVTRAQFVAAFDHWFTAWNVRPAGTLTRDQLRAGIARDLCPAGPATSPAGR